VARKRKVKIYEDLRQSLEEAAAYERGEAVDLRMTRMPSPPKPLQPKEIREIREHLNASQALFARFLCVSLKAVQSWEQGSRRPRKTALRLLQIARKHPGVLLLNDGDTGRSARRHTR
jgi:putative transcriptional regulator